MNTKTIALSRDAEAVAACFFRLLNTTLRFKRPHIIHPRMRAALDELTDARLLQREDDPRGPMKWTPLPELAAAARKFKAPGNGESFPMTSE